MITTEQGQRVSDELGAVAYVECSSVVRQNTPHIFEIASEQILERKFSKQGKKGGNCNVM